MPPRKSKAVAGEALQHLRGLAESASLVNPWLDGFIRGGSFAMGEDH